MLDCKLMSAALCFDSAFVVCDLKVLDRQLFILLLGAIAIVFSTLIFKVCPEWINHTFDFGNFKFKKYFDLINTWLNAEKIGNKVSRAHARERKRDRTTHPFRVAFIFIPFA